MKAHSYEPNISLIRLMLIMQNPKWHEIPVVRDLERCLSRIRSTLNAVQNHQNQAYTIVIHYLGYAMWVNP